MFNVHTPALIEADQLAFRLTNASDEDEDVFDLIVALDQHIEDWDFTERVYRHFKEQHKEFKRVTKGDK